MERAAPPTIDPITSVADPQQLIDENTLANLAAGTPALAMIPQRNDARAMLAKFYSQHPFVPITPITQNFAIPLAPNVPVEVTLPNGTIAAIFTGQLQSAIGLIYGSFDGIPTLLAGMSAVEGSRGNFPLTGGGRAYFVYGKRQVQFLSTVAAMAFYECYMGEDGILG